MTKEERLLEAWKVTVEVQMHFNELEMKVRSFAITVLAAFLAASRAFEEPLLEGVDGVPQRCQGLPHPSTAATILLGRGHWRPRKPIL